MSIDISQSEADALIAMEKVCTDSKDYSISGVGDKVNIELESTDGQEKFRLTIIRGRINVEQVNMNNLARQSLPLVRIDLNGPDHKNPDGEIIACPHIHIYREGFGDKWAVLLTDQRFEFVFSDVSNTWQTLQDMYIFCNISKPPNIKKGLWT